VEIIAGFEVSQTPGGEFDLNQGSAAERPIMVYGVSRYLLTVEADHCFSVYACDALNGTT
jgi:hypothetical protein